MGDYEGNSWARGSTFGIDFTVDERLEELSDKVRMGIPININEAFEVVEYQSHKQKHKQEEYEKLNIFQKIIKWFKS